MTENEFALIDALREQIGRVSVEANAANAEVAVLIGVLISELRHQSSFNSVVVEKHLLDRVDRIKDDPRREQAAKVLLTIDETLRALSRGKVQ